MAGDPLFDITGNGGTTDQLIVTVSGTDTPYTGTGVSTLRLVVNGKTQPNPLQDAGGAWSGITGLVPGTNTIAAVETVDGVTQTTRTVTYVYASGIPAVAVAPATPVAPAAPAPAPAAPAPAAPAAPAVAITTAGGFTAQPAFKVSGTATPGAAVTLSDDGSLVSTTAGADGGWSVYANLTPGKNDLSATVQDASGNVVTSNGITETLDTTLPSVSISPAPRFVGGTTAVMSGTVSDDHAVAGVEIYEDGTALGAATVAADGSWTFAHDFGQGTYDGLRAVGTDAAGNVATSPALYALVTGIADHPYTNAVVQTGADGSVSAITTLTADGSVGSQTIQGPNGRPVATGYQDGQWLFSLGHDVMTGNGSDEHFVFNANMGHTEITDFVVGGAGHDTIALSADDGFGSVAEILAQTTMNRGSAVIHITPDDTIRLDGVTKAQLAHHPRDFGVLV